MSEMSREKIIALHNRGQRQEAIEEKGKRVIGNLLNPWRVSFDHLLNETESSKVVIDENIEKQESQELLSVVKNWYESANSITIDW